MEAPLPDARALYIGGAGRRRALNRPRVQRGLRDEVVRPRGLVAEDPSRGRAFWLPSSPPVAPLQASALLSAAHVERSATYHAALGSDANSTVTSPRARQRVRRSERVT